METYIDLNHFRRSINQENIVYISFAYLSDMIESWWEHVSELTPFYLAKFQLIHLLMKHAKREHLYFFDKVGAQSISAICINNIFLKDCPKLAMLVHEALSEIFALNDIKYPYEEHKKLYLKAEGLGYRDWGNGYGEITPHADDLYEDIDVDYLSLTVCRDNTGTPTECYLPKDFLQDFTDKELKQLLIMRAKFISGKNIRTLKTRVRNVIDYNDLQGYKFFLDFRIDNDTGPRMVPVNKNDHILFQKLRTSIKQSKKIQIPTQTGSFLIIANYKILHARAQMNLEAKLAKHTIVADDYTKAPRLLYRSKGQDVKLMLN